ncbi:MULTISPECIES: hypothetical protein [unclassified Pseudomonas]|uniref:hypothetical protein n=1 Tax=unclassified Pseudomonas TaxID=196821 RepID=UPI002AC901C8|nr:MULTISPECIES: hypothetical protein [unclassified Pseudomonas]MEB0046897.1 hypothetical protein [Pseudomonas sp. Dout3]MEB0098627.1 hypothetical protein [Pseudomonas sp. DC1.2]WPX59593.1 hypothetical protein RHM68_02755 [Pseudomonas sp. DC1.2]
MRLINTFQLCAWERQQAYSSEEAVEHVRQALHDHPPIAGLDELRAGLLIDIDSEVLDQVERGEWCLIKPEADYGDWVMPVRTFDQKIMLLMKNPPVQPSRSPRIFRLVDSVTGEPLERQRYIATLDGQAVQRSTDGEGIAHLFTPDEVRQISMEVIGASASMDV